MKRLQGQCTYLPSFLCYCSPPVFCVFGNRILQSKLNMGLLCSTQHMAADVWDWGGFYREEGWREGEPQNGNKGKTVKEKREMTQAKCWRGRVRAGRGIEEARRETERWGNEMESLKALKHFALPAQQMLHSVWHSDLWACSIYTLTMSLQDQHTTHIKHQTSAAPLPDSNERETRRGVEKENNVEANKMLSLKPIANHWRKLLEESIKK